MLSALVLNVYGYRRHTHNSLNIICATKRTNSFFVWRAPSLTLNTVRIPPPRVLEKSQSHGEDGNAQEVCFKLKKAKNIYHVMEDEFKSAELSEAYSGLE